MDAYKEMLNKPGFADLHNPFYVLGRNVEDCEAAEGIYANDPEALFAVEGLAIISSSLTMIHVDIPNFGRTTISNCIPDIKYMSATPKGYEEKPMALTHH